MGGAIALGHPLGATGAIRVGDASCTACAASKLKYGMVTMCIGTGMGAAGIFERSDAGFSRDWDEPVSFVRASRLRPPCGRPHSDI